MERRNIFEERTHKNGESKRSNLLDIVLSRSLGDICNKKLYKDEVKEISERFESVTSYMKSFMFPLLEETREALLSEMQNVIKELQDSYGKYEPESGDLISVTDVKPKRIEDINRPSMQGNFVAYVTSVKDKHSNKMHFVSSRPIDCMNKKLFAVYIGNLTMNLRIWKSLNHDPNGPNLNVIESLLRVESSVSVTYHTI
ncbi:hypothetical protein V2J09_005262 [Rumex salicifolius]